MFTKLRFIRLTSAFGFTLGIFLFNGCGASKDVTVPEYIEETSTEVEPEVENEVETVITNNENNSSETEEVTNFHAHKLWSELTKKYVSLEGWVNYEGFIKDSVKFNAYLNDLSMHHPDDSWTDNEAKAYWINVYNAFTVKLIADNYPVKSIKELGGSIYKVNTAWDIKFIKLGDQTYDLNNVEHGILRDEYPDPRIHAAVNCASISCPKILNEAYTPEKLEMQLNNQMEYFINDSDKNEISKTKVKISPLLKWYKGDFTKDGQTIIEFLNKYSKTKIDSDATITYQDYNWNLNKQ